jgi:hypothetical protein
VKIKYSIKHTIILICRQLERFAWPISSARPATAALPAAAGEEPYRWPARPRWKTRQRLLPVLRPEVRHVGRRVGWMEHHVRHIHVPPHMYRSQAVTTALMMTVRTPA